MVYVTLVTGLDVGRRRSRDRVGQGDRRLGAQGVGSGQLPGQRLAPGLLCGRRVQYSRFCDLFREFERRLSPVMRQHHAAGDKLFVDYSGKKVPIVDPDTGVVREAEIFVAVLGASSLTYAEATWSQALPDWIGAHVRLFRFLGGTPRLIVPDYVTGHIIGLLCRSALCGQRRR